MGAADACKFRPDDFEPPLLFLVVIGFGLADGQGLSPTSGCRNVPAKPAAAQMKQDSAR